MGLQAIGGSFEVRVACPKCRTMALFEKTGQPDYAVITSNSRAAATLLGVRRCPDSTCHEMLVFIADGERIVESYPPLTIEFDTTDIPRDIVDTLTEAIKCNSMGCFKASVVMVRKAVEILLDAQGAVGDNLYTRIEWLRANKTDVPKQYVDDLHSVRALGNDGVHVVLKDFDNVGQEESEIAIEFAKEVLKSVYQMNRMGARLSSLKKKLAPPSAPASP